MRLDKFINDLTGEGRSVIKKEIKKNKVTVNGVCIKNPDEQIDPNVDQITYKGMPLIYKEHYYYILNKPSGVVSATKDNIDKTVIDILTDLDTNIRSKLFPVGRLDKDTEGLLLLTDDGELSHELLAPGKHVEKTYFCRLAKSINEEALKQLESGVDIGEEKITLPAKALKIADNEIELTITEGKFHQVKRMLKAVENEVVYLKRIQMGNFRLPDDLPIGSYRELTNEELEKMRN